MDTKMNAFKRLIKESVREAVREELSNMMSIPRSAPQYAPQYEEPIYEQRSQARTPSQTEENRMRFLNAMGIPQTKAVYTEANIDVDNIPPAKREFLKEQANSNNPFLDILAETAASMRPGEESNFRS